MWISELSERTQVPIDTIKHYLRIGVLPKGTSVANRRSEYDESHVDRLLLIRAMIEIGDMRLDSVRRVFDAADATSESLRGAVGRAHYEMSRRLVGTDQPSAASLAMVDGVIARRGWEIAPESLHRLALANSLDTLGKLDDSIDDLLLDFYADTVDKVAAFEISHVDVTSHDTAIRDVVVGTALYEPLILLLRRLAQENASRNWPAEETWSKGVSPTGQADPPNEGRLLAGRAAPADQS